MLHVLRGQTVCVLRAGRIWKSDDRGRCQAAHIAENDPALLLHRWCKFHIDNFLDARHGVVNGQHDHANGRNQRSEEEKGSDDSHGTNPFDLRPKLGGVLIRVLHRICVFVYHLFLSVKRHDAAGLTLGKMGHQYCVNLAAAECSYEGQLHFHVVSPSIPSP